MSSSRRGMTLIELMAALALGGVILGGAHALFSSLGDAGIRTTQRAAIVDDIGLGNRRLRESVAMLVGPAEGGQRFSGDTESARFTSRCRRAGGWTTPCSLELQLVVSRDSTRVELSEDGGSLSPVMRLPGRARLRYLERRWESDIWIGLWKAELSAPVAIAIVGARDTVVFVGAGR